MNDTMKNQLNETFKKIKEVFPDIELGTINEYPHKNVIDVLVPKSLESNDILEDMLAETALSMILDFDVNTIFCTMPKK